MKVFPVKELDALTRNTPQAKAILEALGTEIKDINTVHQKDLIKELRDNLLIGPLKEHTLQSLWEKQIDSKIINKLDALAFFHSPPTDDDYAMMAQSETKTDYINTFLDSVEGKKAGILGSGTFTMEQQNEIKKFYEHITFTTLDKFNFKPKDYVGSNMSLALLQKHYTVDRLQKAGFVLQKLIAARQQSNMTVFKPLIETSRKGGIFGRIYTESITADFARQLLSAGMTPDQLYKELKTDQLPPLRRFVTNLHVLQARALNAMSGNKQAQVAPHVETSQYKPLSTNEINKGNQESNDSLASTAPLSRRDSNSSIESEPEGSPPKPVQ